MFDNTTLDFRLAGLPTPGEFTVITCVLIFCGLFGLIFNFTTILVFVRVSELRCPINVFIMALAFCDLSTAVLGIPFAAASSAYNRWIFGKSACSWYGFIMSFLGYTSIYLLTAISVERYLLITNPFSRPLITNQRAVGVVVLCIAIAFLLSLLPVVGWSSYKLEAAFISCSVNWQSNNDEDIAYVVTVFLLCLFLPVTLMVFSYFNIFLTVHSLNRNRLWIRSSHISKRHVAIEYRTTRNILFVIGAFLLSWTPYSVVSLWAAFGNPSDISPISGTVPALIAKSSVVWNPLIYVLTNRQFRSHILSVFPCFIRKKEASHDSAKSEDRIEMNVMLTKCHGLGSAKNNYQSVTATENDFMNEREDVIKCREQHSSHSSMTCLPMDYWHERTMV